MIGPPANYMHQTMKHQAKKITKTMASSFPVESVVPTILSDRQYVWKHIGILRHFSTFLDSQIHKYGDPIQYYINNGGMGNNGYNPQVNYNEQFNQSLPEFIELLKETFIGCDIIVDPLKTYLIIDWS
jgi:hypothetical protein